MTTTAAGDAAVARLAKATEAFEKIITGASNQVVDVPGYGNQLTLAARVDERLDETTATAAAEAVRSRNEADRATTQANAADDSVMLATAEFNKAKTQADRAQNEADRASQITGLDTVAEAVGLAALPLPDVWAPLSDSLRLITGYGREITVGDDVVAQMVNFSRATGNATYTGKDGKLHVAAVNEPRFEKEGLLIEGQSTNLIPVSGTLNTVTLAVSEGLHTLSFYGGGSVVLSGSAAGTLIGAGVDKRAKITFIAMSGMLTITVTGNCNNAQLEPLPFATSYIPTNGAAATRAADLAWLKILNAPVDDGVSVAAECDVIAVDNTYPRIAVGKGMPDLFCSPPSSWYPSNASGLNNIRIAYTKGHQCFNGLLFSHLINVSDDNRAQQISLLSQYSNGQSTGFGHIRNLRIWHRDLSVEQLKAIA